MSNNVKYTLVGKVALAVVVGELPRIGDMLVLDSDDGISRFNVIYVQHFLLKTALGGRYKQTRIEVGVELADKPG
jgi:hypothetical protein